VRKNAKFKYGPSNPNTEKMTLSHNILVLNIGSTTTKIAVFEKGQPKFQETIAHGPELTGSLSEYMAQFSLYLEYVKQILVDHRIDVGQLDMIVSQGGLTAPISSGVYLINQRMCDDLRSGKYGQHPTNLGPLIANDLAESAGIRAVIVDSPSTDEFHDLARISGMPEIERKSAFHALNQKASARMAAQDINISYAKSNMVVAHLGGGITVGAHCQGKVVDSTIGVGEGALTPERAGALPLITALRLLESGKLSLTDLRRKLTSEGGLLAYLGTNDMIQVETKIRQGHEKALLLLQTMAYQIAKDIGAMSTVLNGNVDAIVLTGGLANSLLLVESIADRVSFIAPVKVYPGEQEMLALAAGALRVLIGTDEIQHYGHRE
jgi:butyrate kinase